MPGDEYLHGYSPEEQRRLIAQADYWRDDLILPDLPYKPGGSLLEIGCGAGAVLKVLGDAHPGLKLSGIDLSQRQIDFAKQHLSGRGADLRVGDALKLPWPDASFDHVYMMWFLEHVADPVAALKEARRVLKPGGSIIANETDYASMQLEPPDSDWEYFKANFCRLFAKGGRVSTGLLLGEWLLAAGFENVRNPIMGFDWDAGEEMRLGVEYVLAFIEPELSKFEGDAERNARGVSAFRSAGLNVRGHMSVRVNRGIGVKAS